MQLNEDKINTEKPSNLELKLIENGSNAELVLILNNEGEINQYNHKNEYKIIIKEYKIEIPRWNPIDECYGPTDFTYNQELAKKEFEGYSNKFKDGKFKINIKGDGEVILDILD